MDAIELRGPFHRLRSSDARTVSWQNPRPRFIRLDHLVEVAVGKGDEVLQFKQTIMKYQKHGVRRQTRHDVLEHKPWDGQDSQGLSQEKHRLRVNESSRCRVPERCSLDTY